MRQFLSLFFGSRMSTTSCTMALHCSNWKETPASSTWVVANIENSLLTPLMYWPLAVIINNRLKSFTGESHLSNHQRGPANRWSLRINMCFLITIPHILLTALVWRSRSIIYTVLISNFNRSKCSFGYAVLVRDERIFFSDMPGNRVHVIDVQKGEVNILLDQKVQPDRKGRHTQGD